MGFGGCGPIPWNVIRDYAVENALEEDNRQAFIQVMMAMDTVFLEDQATETKKKTEEAKNTK